MGIDIVAIIIYPIINIIFFISETIASSIVTKIIATHMNIITNIPNNFRQYFIIFTYLIYLHIEIIARIADAISSINNTTIPIDDKALADALEK